MRCEEIRGLVSAWIDGELPARDARTVADHVAACPECGAYAADLRHLSAELARTAGEPAPWGLGDRVRAGLAKEERPRVRWRDLAQYAAVCVLSVVSTWSFLRLPASTSTAQHDVVAAHVRSLLQDSPIQVASADTHTVRPWFAGKVEFAPPVRDLAAEGFPLAGGRLDYVDGHRVATLVYHHGRHTISVFVWPEAAVPSSLADQAAGLNLLSWSKDGMIWWAVSDAGAEELRELRALL